MRTDGTQMIDQIHQLTVLFIHHINAGVEFFVPDESFNFFFSRRVHLSLLFSIWIVASQRLELHFKLNGTA
jgi:hypothetical protein